MKTHARTNKQMGRCWNTLNMYETDFITTISAFAIIAALTKTEKSKAVVGDEVDTRASKSWCLSYPVD